MAGGEDKVLLGTKNDFCEQWSQKSEISPFNKFSRVNVPLSTNSVFPIQIATIVFLPEVMMFDDDGKTKILTKKDMSATKVSIYL
ncbi:MAG: hypothetical protein KME54_07455 [Tolypothrix brevis GSE-NOS-MK-07-07A]|jgi:hypothetical protein|nr:hypothetical protein [Tolypothrix brevis GSE-NOS-MK-07-07A]